jgi:hypothetical protein
MKNISITCLSILTLLIACGGSSPEGSLKSFLNAPDQNNYEKFLNVSLKAQMLDFNSDDNSMTAQQYFEKWRNERGDVINIEAYGQIHPFTFENLYQTEAVSYTVTYDIPELKSKVDNTFQLVLITEEIKESLPWLLAEPDQWVVMDNLFY